MIAYGQLAAQSPHRVQVSTKDAKSNAPGGRRKSLLSKCPRKNARLWGEWVVILATETPADVFLLPLSEVRFAAKRLPVVDINHAVEMKVVKEQISQCKGLAIFSPKLHAKQE